ncbi:Protein of unknown function [Escherichia coli D6-113.11]|nr:Protein of unknown function [Escherichia coli D6-113.11]CDU36497.1 Protein of unknown function [Escherichia coli D6-113.11]
MLILITFGTSWLLTHHKLRRQKR